MFVKNLFKSEQEKITKVASKKIEDKIGLKEVVYLGFQDRLYLPKINKNTEIIHSDSVKISTVLRLVRDKPNIFMDYLTKDNISLDEDHSSAIKHYFSHKNYSKILKTLTKLDLMQLKNNLKSISGRIKKTYIVNDKIDLVVKNLDLEDVVFVVSSKNFDNLDFLIKSRNASKIIFKNCNKDLNTFLEENKFEEIHKSVFFR
jgi:hypothetical protein